MKHDWVVRHTVPNTNMRFMDCKRCGSSGIWVNGDFGEPVIMSGHGMNHIHDEIVGVAVEADCNVAAVRQVMES